MARPKPTTHCKNGHEWIPENIATHVVKSGTRIGKTHQSCKICDSDKYKKWYAKDPKRHVERSAKYNAANREKVNATKKVLRNDRKLEFIKLMGGKCERCGYSEHPAALDFNHKDPQEKLATLSQKLGNWTFERSWTEIQKCNLLCANCHRIWTHDPDSF